MSKLQDLKTLAASKLASVHTDVTNYISALEAKVQSNSTTLYAVGGIVALIVILVIVHKIRHG